MRFSKVAVGEGHACGLTRDGLAYCWGNNGNGQLGDGSVADVSSLPVAVLGGLHFVGISAGGYHTCAWTKHGEAYCWGYDGSGELGDGNGQGFWPSDAATQPVAVVGGLRFTSVAAGGLHTCGITNDGRAYCWGKADNYLGLGDADLREPYLVPTAVATNAWFKGIAAGDSDTCAWRATGAADCWGANQFGQLGDGTTTASAFPVAVR